MREPRLEKEISLGARVNLAEHTYNARIKGKCEGAHTTGRNQIGCSEEPQLATHGERG